MYDSQSMRLRGDPHPIPPPRRNDAAAVLSEVGEVITGTGEAGKGLPGTGLSAFPFQRY